MNEMHRREKQKTKHLTLLFPSLFFSLGLLECGVIRYCQEPADGKILPQCGSSGLLLWRRHASLQWRTRQSCQDVSDYYVIAGNFVLLSEKGNLKWVLHQDGYILFFTTRTNSCILDRMSLGTTFRRDGTLCWETMMMLCARWLLAPPTVRTLDISRKDTLKTVVDTVDMDSHHV